MARCSGCSGTGNCPTCGGGGRLQGAPIRGIPTDSQCGACSGSGKCILCQGSGSEPPTDYDKSPLYR